MLNYNDKFLQRMKDLFNDDNEFNAFLSALNDEPIKSVYVNQNKMSVEKFKDIVDFSISPIDYERAGFYTENLKLGRHPLSHAGAMYMQEPSAMFTVNALHFKGNEKVLDMCASPGGKSIQIANRIPNGVLVSNEFVKSRSEILFSNIERMGLKNVIVTNDSPENIANAYANTFDVCLVDAPCSGEGMFRKGQDMIDSWNENLPKMCAKRQIEILDSANKTLKQGGFLIYSTCTYSKEENEDVINHFLNEHNYKLIPINHHFSAGIDMPQAARLYPHIVKGEGQFVAVLQKLEENDLCSSKPIKLKPTKYATDFINENLTKTIPNFEFNNFSYYVEDETLIKKNINYVSLGVKLGEVQKSRFVPHHNLFTAFGLLFKNKLEFHFTDELVAKYLKGETFDVNLPNGYGVLLIDKCPVGGFRISNGTLKNLYPKGLRNFKS